MNGYMKYFDNAGKVMSIMIEDDSVLVKYGDVWNKIKEIKSIKLHSNAGYDEKYKKAKVKKFNGVVNTNFSDNEVPKERVHYTCIACTNIDSVIKMDKRNYPQVYIEERKKKMVGLIDIELEILRF